MNVCALNVRRPERLKEGVATSRPGRDAAAAGSKNQGQARCIVPPIPYRGMISETAASAPLAVWWVGRGDTSPRGKGRSEEARMPERTGESRA